MLNIFGFGICFLFTCIYALLKYLRVWSELPSSHVETMLGVISLYMRHLYISHDNVKRDCNLSGPSLLPLRSIPTNISHTSETEVGCRKPEDPFAYYSPGYGISIIREICCVSMLIIMNENENRLVKGGFP
jgi:hypothetical protein